MKRRNLRLVPLAPRPYNVGERILATDVDRRGKIRQTVGMTGEDIVQRAARKIDRAAAELKQQVADLMLRRPAGELYGDIHLTAAIHKSEVKTVKVGVLAKIDDE